jgi:hypothetical protein
MISYKGVRLGSSTHVGDSRGGRRNCNTGHVAGGPVDRLTVADLANASG